MKRKTILIILFTSVLFLFSFLIGYKIMDHKVNQKYLLSEDNTGERSQAQDLDLEILREEDLISPNTDMVLKIFYASCNHNITRLKSADDEIINMTERQFIEYIKENHPETKIISFSSKEIVLREERKHLCPNHYIIGEANGYIAIYGIDEEGRKYLDKVFKDYPISLLKEIDRKKLINGIVVDTEEELSDVLENFIS